jgi:hypothetical protein
MTKKCEKTKTTLFCQNFPKNQRKPVPGTPSLRKVATKSTSLYGLPTPRSFLSKTPVLRAKNRSRGPPPKNPIFWSVWLNFWTSRPNRDPKNLENHWKTLKITKKNTFWQKKKPKFAIIEGGRFFHFSPKTCEIHQKSPFDELSRFLTKSLLGRLVQNLKKP